MNLKEKILLLFVIIISSCGNPIDNAEFQKSGYKVSRFVPSLKTRYFKFVEAEVNSYTDGLGIYPITKGFDSIQYRLWIQDDDFCPKSYSSETLFIIKKYKTGPWTAILLKFGRGDLKGDSSKIVCKEIKSIEPKNWDYFVDSMKKLNVNKWVGNTFFTNEQYHGGYSTNFIFFEMGTTVEYRLITHYAPRTIVCEEQECKEVRAFLNLISEEFNLPKFKYYVGS